MRKSVKWPLFAVFTLLAIYIAPAVVALCIGHKVIMSSVEDWTFVPRQADVGEGLITLCMCGGKYHVWYVGPFTIVGKYEPLQLNSN